MDPVATSFYFMSLLIIGQFILLNLFIAILIENFDQLSIRNDLKSKLHKLRNPSLKENLLQCFRRNKARVAPTTTSIMDDLINDDLQKEIKHKDSILK